MKHGYCGTKVYRTWKSIRSRCNNKNTSRYQYYGGRGIKVCERWNKFENFLEDMGTPKENESIDRINVNGNYEPSNCRWASKEEQALNKQNYKNNKYRGVSLHKRDKKWYASVKYNHKQYHIGIYKSEIEAAKAFDKYVIENNLPNKLNFRKEM